MKTKEESRAFFGGYIVALTNIAIMYDQPTMDAECMKLDGVEY